MRWEVQRLGSVGPGPCRPAMCNVMTCHGLNCSSPQKICLHSIPQNP